MKRLLVISTILISMAVVLLIACQKEDSTKTVSQPGDANSTEGSILISDRTFEGLNGFTGQLFGHVRIKICIPDLPGNYCLTPYFFSYNGNS